MAIIKPSFYKQSDSRWAGKRYKCTDGGANIFQRTLTSPKYYPKYYVTSGSYYGAYSIGASLSPTGELIVRNATNREFAKMSSSNTITVTFTYVMA